MIALRAVSAMKILPFLLLFAAVLPASARAGECMDGAPDLAALIQCAKSEVVPLEKKVEIAFQRAVERYRGDAELSAALRESKNAWDAYRNAQCSVEGQAGAQRAAASRALELQRALMSCVQRSFERRLSELEAL